MEQDDPRQLQSEGGSLWFFVQQTGFVQNLKWRVRWGGNAEAQEAKKKKAFVGVKLVFLWSKLSDIY